MSVSRERGNTNISCYVKISLSLHYVFELTDQSLHPGGFEYVAWW